MDQLRITPEQVDEIFASRAGESTDYNFKKGYYAAQAVARLRIANLAHWETAAGPTGSRPFAELAAAAEARWSPEARQLYEAAGEAFKKEMAARATDPATSLRERVARELYASDLPEYAEKLGWSEEEETWREGYRRNADAAIAALLPEGSVAVSQTFLHAVIQSLTEAGDESLVATALEYLELAESNAQNQPQAEAAAEADPEVAGEKPAEGSEVSEDAESDGPQDFIDGFSTVDEAIEQARRVGFGEQHNHRSWQYAWRAFFPEIDGEGKPVPGSFGDEYEWLDFDSFKAALEAAQEAQEEEDRKPQEDETHRLGYSIWKREHHQPGAWEPVAENEEEITDGSAEYGWRSFMPNHDEEGKLLEGLGEEYEWLDAESLEEARSQVALLQEEENLTAKERELTPLSYSVWKRTPERFGDWIPMARIDSPELNR